MAKATPIKDLRRSTKTVICPACGEESETFRVVDAFTTGQTARLAAVSVVTAGIPAISYLRGPRANWLAHYCRSCGIRLTTYIQAGDAAFPLTDNAIASSLTVDPELGSPDHTVSNARTPVKIVRSPLGSPSTPPGKVNFTDLSRFADRYRGTMPTMILDVDWNKWYDMPVSFHRLDDREKVYNVEFLNFDLDGALSGSMFFPARRDPHFLYNHSYGYQNANIRVMRTAIRPERVAGLIQLKQTEWDVTLYSPEPTKREDSQDAPSRSPSYSCRNHPIGDNHHVFARAHPHFLWTSSEGPLLWTIQRCADGLTPAGVPAEDRLILLDCYDRLIAMENCNGEARTKKWDSAPRDYNFQSHLNFRLYEAVSHEVVHEIIVSYIAICAQLRRKGDWDVVNLSD